MDFLVPRHIRVVQAWTATESTLGVPNSPRGSFLAEEAVAASGKRFGIGE
jgi:hypothetical protein